MYGWRRIQHPHKKDKPMNPNQFTIADARSDISAIHNSANAVAVSNIKYNRDAENEYAVSLANWEANYGWRYKDGRMQKCEAPPKPILLETSREAIFDRLMQRQPDRTPRMGYALYRDDAKADYNTPVYEMHENGIDHTHVGYRPSTPEEIAEYLTVQAGSMAVIQAGE